MANIYDCALVYTPQIWVEKFHRHCTNTGQLKIRSFIYDSTVLFSDEYDVAIISDSWPALSRSLIERVQQRGAKVIGVCEANEASREFLSSLGVDGIVDSSLEAKQICNEIINLLDTLTIQTKSTPEVQKAVPDFDLLDESLIEAKTNSFDNAYSNICTVLGSGGSGASEMSLVLAQRLVDSLIIDVDFEHPSLAPRNNLDIEPHIIDAIETSQNNKENFLSVVKRGDGFSTIVGLTHASLASDIRDYEMTALLEEAKVHFSNIVLDCGNVSPYSSFFYLYEALFQATNTFVIVGDCSPHGIIRTLERLVIVAEYLNQDVTENKDLPIIEIIINFAPKDKQLQQQIVDEIQYCQVPCNITFVSENKEIRTLTWQGNTNYSKKWTQAFDEILTRTEEFSRNRKKNKHIDLIELEENEKQDLVGESA